MPKLAVTGCTGEVGRRVVIFALEQGYSVVGIDVAQEDMEFSADPRFAFLQADLRDYDQAFNAIRGCDGIVQLAGVRWPADYVATTHNTYVVTFRCDRQLLRLPLGTSQ